MKRRLISFLRSIPTIAKYVFALAAVAAVSFLFPTTAKFRYPFSLGTLWQYEDLYAQFDFPIQKSATEFEDERRKLEEEIAPYYEVKLSVIQERKEIFEREFEKQIGIVRRDGSMTDVLKNNRQYLDFGERLLTRWLTRGILGDSLLLRKDKNTVISIVRGNTVEKQTIQNLLTVEKMKELLNDSLQLSRLREPVFLYPLLENALMPNLFFNQDLTKKNQQQQLEDLPQTRGMVRKNELLVRQNAIIDDQTYQKLSSYKKEYESNQTGSRKFYFVFGGYLSLIGMMTWLFMAYLRTHARSAFERLRWTFFLMAWVVLFTYLLYLTKAANVMNIYMVPFCIAPIVIKNFYNRELAFLCHLLIVFTAAALVEPNFQFVLLQSMAGMVATYSKSETRYWGGFFRSIFLIVLVYVIGMLAFHLIEEGSFQKIKWAELSWMPLNGFLTLLAYPLIPLLGEVFGFTSNIKLSELSDLNHPLLNELSSKAPGTLQHSLQVANLCEKAANAIGANALLVKVSALYHDVGKSLKPQYFVENQTGESPHLQLSPIESAKIIIEHVTEGVKMAQKNGLPEVMTNFIRTHHGTTRVEFFYRMYLKENPNGIEDIAHFTYAGPTPRTKEEVILMLADSIEASAKSLKQKTVEGLSEIVERIANDKISQGQFKDANITFAEIEICKKVFKETLKSIYHDRIEYPKA